MNLSLGSIVASLGGTLVGDEARTVSGLAALETATPNDISFLSNPRYRQQLLTCKAACVVVAPTDAQTPTGPENYIVADDPYLYFARLTRLWRQSSGGDDQAPGIHPSAVISKDAEVDPTAYVGPLCVVARGARIGAHTVLHSRITVGEGCTVGAHCLLHAGVVIGADGFGFAHSGTRWEKIEQLGAVQIGDYVEIGANTCIDRGALQDTVIEEGVKLDNLIQIGHNVRVGRHTAMAGCVGVAGSAVIGSNCTIGGGAIILGHLTLADRVNVSAGTLVSKSILRPGHYTGFFPCDSNANWERNAASVKQLHQLRERIRILESKVKS